MPVMKRGIRHLGRQETRRRILDAALDIFAAEGFDSVTVKRIAERSGLTDGALYYYFDSKQAMLTALMEERWNIPRGLEQVSRIVSEPLSPAILDRVVDNIFDALARNQSILRIVMRQALAEDPLAMRLRKDRREKWRVGLLHLFLPHLPPEEADRVVDILLSVSTGLFLAGQMDHGREFARVSQGEQYRANVRRLVRRMIPLDRFPLAKASS
ncbi:MAG: TetR/AcrR family transcriptional regulator [Dehalococcoidia bacterium]|nr:TetR/AcrR family transcriptional regulator [Dehalococcoidia bacterium]